MLGASCSTNDTFQPLAACRQPGNSFAKPFGDFAVFLWRFLFAPRAVPNSTFPAVESLMGLSATQGSDSTGARGKESDPEASAPWSAVSVISGDVGLCCPTSPCAELCNAYDYENAQWCRGTG